MIAATYIGHSGALYEDVRRALERGERGVLTLDIAQPEPEGHTRTRNASSHNIITVSESCVITFNAHQNRIGFVLLMLEARTNHDNLILVRRVRPRLGPRSGRYPLTYQFMRNEDLSGTFINGYKAYMVQS